MIVTSNRIRPPAVLANMAATVDQISALGEALTIARRLWTESTPFDLEGAHYRLSGAICEPKPAARLPILIGAGGEKRSLGLVAENADIWNCPTRGDIGEYRRKSRILDEHCKAVGRDPLEIARQVQILAAAITSFAPSRRMTGIVSGNRDPAPPEPEVADSVPALLISSWASG